MATRILVVSDDPERLRMLTSMTEEAGYSVLGSAGFQWPGSDPPSNFRPDLIILDLPFDNNSANGEPYVAITGIPEKGLRTPGVIAQLRKTFTVAELKKALDFAASEMNSEARAANRDDRFRLTFEHASIGMALVSPEGFFLQVNSVFWKMLGQPQDELLQKNFFDLLTREESREARKNFKLMISNEKEVTWLEKEIVDGSGKTAWGLFITYLVRDAAGLPLYFCIQLRDITERIEAIEQLRRSEERFRTIADFTHDWEYWIGPDGRFIWVSPSCLEITGFKPEEFEKDPRLIDRITYPDDLKKFEEHTAWARTNFKPGSFDFRIFTRNGELRWINHNCQPVFGPNGEYRGRRAGNRDVTERKEFEERLGDYHRQLRSLASELTLAEERERRRIAVDLHDRVGHTLALCQIKLNLLQSQTHLPDLDEVVDLLENAIIETRSLTMDLSPPSLYELGLEAALDDLAEEISDEYGLDVEVVDDGSPKPLEDDARVALYRSAKELMINVVKHSGATKMVIDLSRDEQNIIIGISDDGRGFLTIQPRMARSFGLFSIREWLKRLGGEIRMESTPGRGSTMTLISPLKRE